MQTIYAGNLGKEIHQKHKKNVFTERTFTNPGTSRSKLLKSFSATDLLSESNTIPPLLDSFRITENISELLSPACGMTEEEKSAYLAQIQSKLKNGKKLTAEEMRFLQAEYPVLYQQAARIQAMRDSFETQLKHATSKKNAAEIYATSMSLVSDKDPMKEYIIAAYDDVMREFKDSDAYQQLPEDEDEKRK